MSALAAAARPLVTVTREVDGVAVVESVHHGHVVVVTPDGEVRAVGDPDVLVLPRSAVKPLQARACLDLVGAVAGELSSSERAVAWASHRGEARHLAAVRALLTRSATPEQDLTCPVAWPEAATTWPPVDPTGAPSRLRHNCSGKHALFALAGRAVGVTGPALLDPEDALQQHVVAEVGSVLGGVQGLAVDGCGAPAVLSPLVGLARAFATVAGDERYEPVRTAGLARPGLVGGRGRPDTALLRQGVVAKIGAEGVLACGWVDAAGGAWGLAVKAADGAHRASGAVAVGLLAAAGVVPADTWHAPAPTGGGRVVGAVRLAPDAEAIAAP